MKNYKIQNIKKALYNNRLIILSIVIISILIILFLINKKIDNFDNNKEGLNKCDGIIYINLENREDRKQIILNELKKMNINNENKIHKVSGVFMPNNGHKGNVQSFILALTLAKLNDWEMVCIFEDDAEIVNTNNFSKDCDYIINKLDTYVPDWDVIMLGTAHAKKDTVSFDNKICKINSATTKTGIIVKKKYYDKLINNFSSSNDLMLESKKSNDNYEKYASDQRMKVLQETGNWFGFHKDILKQRNIWSSTMRYSYGN